MYCWTYPTLVDNYEATLTPKPVSGDMNSYIQNLIENIERSNRQADYELKRESTEVSKTIIEMLTDGTDWNSDIESRCEIIAIRFLECEVRAREQVEKMNVTIQNGCLIQTLIKEDDKNFKYVIAKGEWNDFLNKTNFEKSEGLQINKKHLGKSCIYYIEYNEDGKFTIKNCKVLLDNQANYFWSDFLELEKALSDENSTKNATKKITELIDNTFRKEYPQDRQYLRNTFITYLKSKDLIDFEEMKEVVFEGYLNSSNNISENVKNSFLEKLNQLPEKGRFARQFTCIRNKIEERIIKSKYILDKHIFLEIQDDYEPGEISKISADIDTENKTYVKIYTDCPEVLETFSDRR